METKNGSVIRITEREEIFLRKADELKVMAVKGLYANESLKKLSVGFLDLSNLAENCSRQSVSKNSRQLSTIFDRTARTIPEDIPFILNAAVNFLDTVLENRGPELQQASA